MVYITAVHLVGGSEHQHIANVRWRNPADGATGDSTREVMVDWIDNKKGEARVANGSSFVNVGVVQGSPPYVRTYADKVWTDNLLALPKY